MKIIALAAALLLLLPSCVPSYERLLAYDHAKTLHQGEIVLLLDGHGPEAEKYAQYGYEKAAQRHLRRDARMWEMFAEAADAFSFCPISLMWLEEADQVLDAHAGDSLLYRMTVERRTLYEGERMDEVYALVLRDRFGRNLPAVFPAEQVIGPQLSVAGIRVAYKQLDRRLEKMWRTAAAAGTQNPYQP